MSQNQFVYQPDDVRLFPKIATLLHRVNPTDILSTQDHSNDFKSSRADYISVRVRILAIVFAFLALIWIPIDYLVMEQGIFSQFLAMRIIFSAAFIFLALWGSRCHVLKVARVRIAGFVLVPGLFFLTSHLLLSEVGDKSAILMGYSFMPLLVMALLAIFPLTLLEGVGYISLSIAIFVLTKLVDSSLFTIDAMGDLWLMLLLGGIALWVELTQLFMLMNLYREATRDALTGLVNRRVLAKKLAEEIERCDRDGSPLYIMLFDLDLFKRINDNFGHKMGDVVLQQFGRILESHCRGTLVAGRYGGEEFLAIVPGHQREEALELAESIRLHCHDVAIKNPGGGENIKFTTSVGVAKRRQDEAGEELFSRVDDELYRAKSSGRDFVSISD